ncbi:hypothetical protein ASD24_29495 [Paenibacillus sp. Root52]|uniref:hypothetical protein n=1 Tax=Paenibacillus sp. Root52 TaxID=1736552 RepID=UPI0006FD45C9|nr:hypothetical protein [Paenibacillus sp. Root52]KQY83744.1 hypothetical protein ASD24_29495 [Paenibacillus sp. Root52]
MKPRKLFKNERILNLNLMIQGKILQKEYRCEQDEPINAPLSLLAIHLKASGLSAYEDGKIVAIIDIV